MLCEAGRGPHMRDISMSWSAGTVEAAAAKLLVGPICAGVGLALQVVHSSMGGFSAGVAGRPMVQFDVQLNAYPNWPLGREGSRNRV